MDFINTASPNQHKVCQREPQKFTVYIKTTISKTIRLIDTHANKRVRPIRLTIRLMKSQKSRKFNSIGKTLYYI
jgi:hypothetical protein